MENTMARIHSIPEEIVLKCFQQWNHWENVQSQEEYFEVY